MRRAARAIIFHGDKILVMKRNKYGARYFTLVGGAVNSHETVEQALVREVREETGLKVIRASLMFIEEHPEPYNEQYIYLCEVETLGDVAVQDTSEEGVMNRLDANTHIPMWVDIRAFAALEFRTPQLQQAILNGLAKGFPAQPIKLGW